MPLFWAMVYGSLGPACVLAWVALLVEGSSQQQRLAALMVSSSVPSANDLHDFVLICLIRPPTNAALLTCLMGLVGGSLRFLTDSAGVSGLGRLGSPFASMMRSFVAYLFFVGGHLYIVAEPLCKGRLQSIPTVCLLCIANRIRDGIR
jgi:hypothetical protein